ncbi:MAG: hypothetical protein HQK65_02525 [Desulfamplus sp.]|nr:hypothetical protein [Desulfamplus sp.]
MTIHYIFYHNKELLKKVKPTQQLNNYQSFEYIDLNSLALPDFMKFSTLSPIENRALYSEYLGIISIKPQTKLIGCFTYSIPLKFSQEWADKTNNHALFLPPIDFDLIISKNYDPQMLYGVEFRPPDCDQVDEIHNSELRIGTSTIQQGPFKGSVIVDSEIFVDFQQWFENAIKYLLSKYKTWHISPETEINSPFTLHGGYKNSETAIDKKFRHGMGDILERLTAYYFGQTFSDVNKIVLGNYLHE